MALCKDGVTYRNIQEQVKKNKDDIDAIIQGNLVMAQMGIKVVGHVSDVSELPDPVTYDGEYGDAFVIGEDKPYNFYIFTRPANGVDNPYWFDLGEFPARGPRGETGATGPVGPQGQSGLSLVAKTYDPNAASGQYIPGTPWINVVTGNVFISNEDFTWTQVGNWKGPQGSTGLTGPTGATGPAGATGPQGPRGEAGGFANFRGILANENLLPNPELMNKSDGFLVGSQPPYDAYVIIGDENNKATWQWANVASTAMPSMIVITAPTGILSEEEMLMIAQNDHVIITDNIHIYKMSEKIVDPNQGTEYWFVCVEVNDEFSNTILKIQVLPDGHYDTFTNALGSSYGVGSYQVNTFNKLHASSDLTVEGNAHFQEDLTVDGTITGKINDTNQFVLIAENPTFDGTTNSVRIDFTKGYKEIIVVIETIIHSEATANSRFQMTGFTEQGAFYFWSDQSAWLNKASKNYARFSIKNIINKVVTEKNFSTSPQYETYAYKNFGVDGDVKEIKALSFATNETTWKFSQGDSIKIYGIK